MCSFPSFPYFFSLSFDAIPHILNQNGNQCNSKYRIRNLRATAALMSIATILMIVAFAIYLIIVIPVIRNALGFSGVLVLSLLFIQLFRFSRVWIEWIQARRRLCHCRCRFLLTRSHRLWRRLPRRHVRAIAKCPMDHISNLCSVAMTRTTTAAKCVTASLAKYFHTFFAFFALLLPSIHHPVMLLIHFVCFRSCLFRSLRMDLN